MTSLRLALRAGLVLLLFVFASASISLFAQQAPESAVGSQNPSATHPQEQNIEAADENDAYRHSPMVQKIGHMLGMSTETAATTFEIVNFAILALLVGGFLVRVLPKTFRDRTSLIQKNLVDARTATEEASARLNSVEDRLSKLDGQIVAMRQQSERDSAADEQRIKASVEEEKKKILASAEQEIAAATVHAQRQLQQYAAELAIEQAARKLVISAETDRLLVQNFARRLTGDGTKGGEN